MTAPRVDLVVEGGPHRLSGTLRPPSDKSISQRALLLGALAEGESEVADVLDSEDVAALRRALLALGAGIATHGRTTTVRGIPDDCRGGPPLALDAGESGTAARLLLGALASFERDLLLDGAPALRGRPMRRVVEPLAAMGVAFEAGSGDALPLRFRGTRDLRPIRFASPVASAQVKSALVLAALAAHGESEIGEPLLSRDHTERLLPSFGGVLERRGTSLVVRGPQRLRAARVAVPGDLSSALYPGVAALAQGDVTLEGVGLNPTRGGALEVLARMGASVARSQETGDVEPAGSLRFVASQLRGVDVEPALFPSLLDDVPALAVAAALARGGTTRFLGAAELRVKESDRIASVAAMLRAFGAEVATGDDRLEVRGGCALRCAEVDAAGDHRVAMAATVLALALEGRSRVRGFECVAKSWPGFVAALVALGVPTSALRVVPAS